jgi:NADH pyrophosphatase NudC (nudix superfamily)
MINKKILAIIKSDKGKFLLLKTNPRWLKVDAWYIVTGGLEKGETYEDGVKREVSEETGLKIMKIIPTEYACDYAWPEGSGKMHHEKAFIVIVKAANPILSREHTAFKWLSKDKFVEKVAWWGDNAKRDLKKLLKDY